MNIVCTGQRGESLGSRVFPSAFRIISRRAQKRREAWGFIIADDALGSGGLSGAKAWGFSIADGSGGLKGREFREKRKRGVAYFLPSTDYWHLHLYHLYFAVIRIRSTHPLHYTVALDGGSEARYDICVAKGRGLWFCRRAAPGPCEGMPGLATACLALRRHAWPCDGMPGLGPILDEEEW